MTDRNHEDVYEYGRQYINNLDGLPDQAKRDLVTDLGNVLETAETRADCDHEDVRITVPPEMLEREGAYLLGMTEEDDGPQEGTVAVFRAICTECKMDLSAPLTLSVDRDPQDQTIDPEDPVTLHE